MDNKPAKDPIAEIMKHSLVELPFTDFDQRMMMQIRREAMAIAKSKKDKNLSSLFFALGCLVGAFLFNWLAFVQLPYTHGVKIFLQVIGVLLFLLCVNSGYKRFINREYVAGR